MNKASHEGCETTFPIVRKLIIHVVGTYSTTARIKSQARCRHLMASDSICQSVMRSKAQHLPPGKQKEKVMRPLLIPKDWQRPYYAQASQMGTVCELWYTMFIDGFMLG